MGYQIRAREGAPFMVGQIVEENSWTTYQAPEWLPADGRQADVLAEPDLFSAIGYRFGGSDGTFLLPDLRTRPTSSPHVPAPCPRCFIEAKPCAEHCNPETCPDPVHVHGGTG